MTATAPAQPRFVRRTQLGANEYRKNFRQIDGDVIAAVTSPEADRVTPLMSKIYLRLVHAPAQYWERDGVLRFEGELRDDCQVTAWEALCEVVGVASATARKALLWMHGQGIIGYFAGKNGVGVRVFLNRAMNSIGTRAAGQKILEFPRASSGGARTSAGEAAFSDSFADLEISDTDRNPRAPKNGAETKPVGKTSSGTTQAQMTAAGIPPDSREREWLAVSPISAVNVDEIVGRLRGELEPCVREIAARAAATAAAREMERTREWFQTKALPKAVRVAQHETYNLLRRQGGVEGRREQGTAGLEVGRGRGDYTVAAAARPLTAEEVRETAEVCVALLEAQGKSIEGTMSEISSQGGGWLLPEDAPRVRALAETLVRGDGPRSGERPGEAETRNTGNGCAFTARPAADTSDHLIVETTELG